MKPASEEERLATKITYILLHYDQKHVYCIYIYTCHTYTNTYIHTYLPIYTIVARLAVLGSWRSEDVARLAVLVPVKPDGLNSRSTNQARGVRPT